jgi:hypothetical protein
MNECQTLGTLVPLQVPWCLGLFDSQFEVTFAERGSLLVEVTATRLIAVKPRSFQDCRVQIEFPRPNQFAFGGGYDEDDFLVLSNYQSHHPTFGSDDDANDRLYQEWLATGNCPNPFAYEVRDSVRVQSITDDRGGLREFLLIGDDSSMYVVTDQFTWRYSPAALPTAPRG